MLELSETHREVMILRDRCNMEYRTSRFSSGSGMRTRRAPSTAGRCPRCEAVWSNGGSRDRSTRTPARFSRTPSAVRHAVVADLRRRPVSRLLSTRAAGTSPSRARPLGSRCSDSDRGTTAPRPQRCNERRPGPQLDARGVRAPDVAYGCCLLLRAPPGASSQIVGGRQREARVQDAWSASPARDDRGRYADRDSAQRSVIATQRSRCAPLRVHRSQPHIFFINKTPYPSTATPSSVSTHPIALPSAAVPA